MNPFVHKCAVCYVLLPYTQMIKFKCKKKYVCLSCFGICDELSPDPNLLRIISNQEYCEYKKENPSPFIK